MLGFGDVTLIQSVNMFNHAKMKWTENQPQVPVELRNIQNAQMFLMILYQKYIYR